MKKYITILPSLFFSTLALSQTIQNVSGSQIVLKRDSVNIVPALLKFKMVERPLARTVKLKVRDIDNGDARLGKDYVYPLSSELTDKEISDATSQEINFNINVLPDTSKIKAKYFNIYFSYERNGMPIEDKFRIAIENPYKPEPKKNEFDTSKWSVRMITGSNFDFFDAPVFKNFAGELKIFLPGISKIKEKKSGKEHLVGIQAGIFNYRYFESDSSRGNIYQERYLLESTSRSLKVDTTQYVTNVYALNANVSYNNWGLYFNPMIRINGNEWYDLYADLHFEGVWRTKRISNNIVTIRKDTLLYSKSDSANSMVLQGYPAIRSIYKDENYFDFYIGIGLPMKFYIKKAFEFYVDPSLGITTFQTVKYDRTTKNGIVQTQVTTKNQLTPFVLTKFQLLTTIAPVDIVLGGEVRIIGRKQLDKYPAYKALYLGAIIPFKK